MTNEDPIIAAADGSALGNPGPAGWAWYIDDNCWAAGGWKHGTNNMGELKAVLDLFEATAHVPERPLYVICDSQYVINALTKWMPGWKKKGWKKSNGKPVLNQDLLKELDAALAGRDYTFQWVKGHSGHELNEAADSRANAAATAFSKGQKPKHGPGFPGGSSSARRSSSGAFAKSGDSASKELPENVTSLPQERLEQLKLRDVSTGDAVEDNDRAMEEAQSADIAQIGPERLAEHQEELLLDPKTYEDVEKLGGMLADDFRWVTPAGKLVDRETVLEHRLRAFASAGDPEIISSELLSDSVALVVSRVATARGSVLRSSVWTRENYRNELGAWMLHYRQETAG